jgi:hypothetical protein
MQKMNKSEQKKFVQEKLNERNAIKKEIADLSKNRDVFIAEKKSVKAENTLDDPILNAVKQQAQAKAFVFE